MRRNLSKSKYLSGLQCEKRLFEINDPDKASPVSESRQRLFEQGKEVGELALKSRVLDCELRLKEEKGTLPFSLKKAFHG